MSGILAVYNLDGRPVDRRMFAQMLDAMAAHGPDGLGHWIDGPIALGYANLRSTPESPKEPAPVLDLTGTLALTFDGRIDNRSELAAELKPKGFTPSDHTDAELALRAYQCWGEDAPRKIVGDFSFALWDGQKRRLVCARDPLGVRLLYYWIDSRTFVCASDTPSLFVHPDVSKSPNLGLIARYASWNFNETVETLYRDVNCLPASHSLTVENGRLRITRFWKPEPDRVLGYSSDTEYAEHFLALFKDAVAARLRGYNPVGAFLSGGLDSSSIVCTAQKLLGEQLHGVAGLETGSLVSDHLPFDERPFINEVIHKSGANARFYHYEQNLAAFDLDKPDSHPDLFSVPTLLTLRPAIEAMTSRGIKAALWGIGGDELLAPGLWHLTDLFRAGKLLELLSQLRNVAAVYSISPWGLFIDRCLKPFIPGPAKAVARKLRHRFRREPNLGLVNPEFLKASGRELKSGDDEVPAFPSLSQQASYEALFVGFVATVGRPGIQTFASRLGLEARHPFLDQRLAEFVLALPPDQQWRGGQSKVVLRNAMVGILPELILNRTLKGNYSSMLNQELERQADMIRRLFEESTLVSLGVLNQDKLNALYDRYRRRVREHLDLEIQLLASLEIFCRQAI